MIGQLFCEAGNRWRRQARAAVAILAAALLIPVLTYTAAAGPASAPGVYDFPNGDLVISLDGKGWGHGVGLCQWGARGRAQAGQTGEQIVAAYYTGTSVQKAVSPDTTIRVLVHSGLGLAMGESPRITGSGGKWQLEASGVGPIVAEAGGYLELTSDARGPRFAVKDKTGKPLGEGALMPAMVLRPQEGNTRFVVGYKPAGSVPGRSVTYYDAYRGELIIYWDGSEVDTVNRLPLEDYLRGVVPGEMPASWHSEALKAQTLAARSYAVWQARARSGQRYDVDDTPQYQVYLGANGERPNVNQIVDATAGQVIVSGGQAIQGFFFSTCAGWTENNESVWPSGQPLPYLRGIRDVDSSGRPYDADSPVFSWTTGRLTVAQLEEIVNGHPSTEVGKLRGLDLSRRSPSGRLLTVSITGSSGTKTVNAEAFLIRYNNGRAPGTPELRSTNFDLKGINSSASTAVPVGTATPGQGTRTPPTATAQSAQPTPTPLPTPTPIPTPVYRLEMTQPAPERPATATNMYAGATGHNVGGAFLSFYNANGGLDIFGHPRTEELLEDGRTVQYFQRARLEFHPDKAGTPYEVQLALLGDSLTTPRRPFATVALFGNAAEHVFFPETGHGLHFLFLRYWQTRGGLDVFGYPISEEMAENGFTVQYFQRARFEYHPELPEAYQVSLGLLGDQLLQQRYWLR